MANTPASERTIVLDLEQGVSIERVAASEITPGELIEFTSADKFQRHGTDGGNATPIMFAMEDAWQGNSIDDDYSADDRVFGFIPYRGCRINALIAEGETVSVGDELVSNGTGDLRVRVKESSSQPAGDLGEDRTVAVAIQDLDMANSSSGVTGAGRCKVIIV